MGPTPPIWNMSHCRTSYLLFWGKNFPVLSARYTRIAPDSIIEIGLPPGPSGSTIDGILPFGLIFRYSGVNCSALLPMLILCTWYGRLHSSSMIETFLPLGVLQVYKSIMIKWLVTVVVLVILLSLISQRLRMRIPGDFVV